MKKYIGFTTLVFIFATQAYAYPTWTENECNDAKGGTIVTVGGDSFCQSNSTMNWWSAYAWCEAMGGRMPQIAELCPGQPITYDQPCGRTYLGNVWSTTVENKNTWHAELGNPQKMRNNTGKTENWLIALCLKNAQN